MPSASTIHKSIKYIKVKEHMLKPINTTQNEIPYIGVFKLPTGEEIIARVVDEDENRFTVEKPLQILATQQGLQFAPIFIMGDHSSVTDIPRSGTLRTRPGSEFESQYKSAISGIVLPKPGNIIT